jgi:hypothetical protein
MKKPQLSKEHLEELKASGLSDETIEASGVYTETDGSVICEILNYSNPNSVNGSNALIIPFGYDGFYRLKLQHPRIRKGSADKVIKYESPYGSTQHPYFPPNTFDEILKHDCNKEIFIVEGEKKALKLWQELKDNSVDAFVIGLTGVYGWKEKKEEKLVLWLDQIHWLNRIVYLCFDNDVHWNTNVSDARSRLGKILKNHGANVKSIDIPIDDPAQKYGVDDYIVKFGIVAFFNCLADAKPINIKGIIDIEVICAVDVQIEPVEWLWHLWIPKGEITILDGNPGLGKSQMVADLAARISRGYALPPIELGVPVCKGQNVMLLCAEDTIEKTVRPRLSVCQADIKRITFLRKKDGMPLSFPNDLDRFEQECVEQDISFVVLDPLMSYIGNEIDTHSDRSSRSVLNRLKEFAEHTNISILCLRHLNKRQGDAAIFRGGGSIAFTASSRCNLMVGKHPTEDDVNVLACTKSNLERKPKSISYTIESVDTPHGPIGRISWLDEVALSADDISDTDKTKQKVNKIERAAQITIESLKKEGPMLSVELQNIVCKLSGISLTTYQHARKKCNLIRSRDPKEKGTGQWYSKLPGQSFTWELKKKEGGG